MSTDNLLNNIQKYASVFKVFKDAEEQLIGLKGLEQTVKETTERVKKIRANEKALIKTRDKVLEDTANAEKKAKEIIEDAKEKVKLIEKSSNAKRAAKDDELTARKLEADNDYNTLLLQIEKSEKDLKKVLKDIAGEIQQLDMIKDKKRKIVADLAG